MASRVKGLTVEIGGDTSKLDKALESTNKQIKDTQSQLKDVEKLLKLDPTNVELLAQKERLLGQAVDQTAGKLNDLKKAEKDVQKQFQEGKVSQAEYDALRREIIDTEQQLKSLESQAKSSNATVSAIFGTMDKVSGAAGNIASKTAGISGAAAGIVGGIFGAGMNAAKGADDLNTLAKQTGLTTAELQKMQYASDLVDVSVSDMTGALAKMKKQMGTDSGAKKFEELGIAVRDANGELRDSSSVFYETLLQLSKVSNETEKDTLAMEIFGKGADSLAGIIDDGGLALRNYGYEAEQLGLILDQDTLNSMNDVNDAMDELKAQAKFTLAKEGAKAMEALLPVFQQVMDALSGLLEWIGSLDSSTIGIIATIAAVVAAISPIAGIISAIANPIGLIITLIAAVTAAVIANWDTISGWLSTAWNAISTFFTNIWETVSGVFKKIWETISNVFHTIVDFIKGQINGILSIINKMIGAVNGLLEKINEIHFDIPDWVPLIGGKTFGFNIPLLKEIPLLASGGMVHEGGSAIVGERGAELLTMNQGRAIVQPLGGNQITQNNTFNNYQPRDGAATVRDLNRRLGWAY